MVSYQFAKIVNTTQLQSEIMTTSIGKYLISLSSSGSMVTINVAFELDEKQFGTLRQTIMNHTPPNAIEQKISGVVVAAMQFGQKIIIDFATQNIMRGATPSDILFLIQKYGPIESLLQSGSLYTALDVISKTDPDRWVTQDLKNKYIGMLKGFLGVP